MHRGVIVANKAVDRRQSGSVTVDPREEPSAEWGWHGTFPKGARIGGWFSAFGLFIMIIGNHENNTENVWLIGLGLTVVGIMLWDIRKRRTAWRK